MWCEAGNLTATCTLYKTLLHSWSFRTGVIGLHNHNYTERLETPIQNQKRKLKVNRWKNCTL